MPAQYRHPDASNKRMNASQRSASAPEASAPRTMSGNAVKTLAKRTSCAYGFHRARVGDATGGGVAIDMVSDASKGVDESNHDRPHAVQRRPRGGVGVI